MVKGVANLFSGSIQSVIGEMEEDTTDFDTVSTTNPAWQSDCERLAGEGLPFRVRGVTTDAQRKFILELGLRRDLVVAHADGVAYFAQPPMRLRRGESGARGFGASENQAEPDGPLPCD